MKKSAIIFGAVTLFVLIFESDGQSCIIMDDPNDYINNPDLLQNGRFECGDPKLTDFDFIPPTYWDRIPYPESYFQADCYAGLHSFFAPPLGDGPPWTIQHPFEGDSFVVLSTGGLSRQIDDRQIRGATISQEVFLSPGDTIIGAYFFGTNDYSPYFDWGQISLHMAGDPNDYPNSVASFDIPETFCSVETVGNYSSTLELSPETAGWIPFLYTVEPNQVGPYLLTCEVVDARDAIYESYYAVDGLRICKGGDPQADLDLDCDVDLGDYSIFSQAWLCFCPDNEFYDPNFPGDPNDYPPPVTDPNIPCQAADFDNNWFVDPNDIGIMSSQWLINVQYD